MVETKEVSNELTASLIKTPAYYSRYSDHATTAATKGSGFDIRHSTVVFP